MPIALDRDIRKTLEKVVADARSVAETGARAALAEIGVGKKEAPGWLGSEQQALRRRLRAHARTLGDDTSSDDAPLDRLVREIAYAHWHRALFARFLVENGLLVDITNNHAVVTADLLAEIAEEEKRDPAEVAADYAGPMLPAIFPADDPVLAMTLPPEDRLKLAKLVDELPAATFKADDSLGWTYQFWQADRKKKINESEVKIGADELPAVTQLFTEDYMVLFLLENTLGAWWAGKKLAEDPNLARDAVDEDELRRRTSPAGYVWTYLRFVREDEAWRPAAGTFPGWPTRAAEITMLDPCMGSGHFLVFALDILTALRREEEDGLGEEAAIHAVLADNLHGLEIDPRCTQIAAFALALAAWKRLGRVVPLPILNLACSGLSIGMGEAEFVRLAEKLAEADGFAGGATDLLGRQRTPFEVRALERRRNSLTRLYRLFEQAPVLGSLIDPRRALGEGDLFYEGFDGLVTAIPRVLSTTANDEILNEAATTARGLARASEILSNKFVLVATNVPYLGFGSMSPILKEYCRQNYPDSKSDLATVFAERVKTLIENFGVFSVVIPQNWLFLGSYERFRTNLIEHRSISIIAALGSGAFETIGGEVVNVVLISLENSKKTSDYSVVDVSSVPNKQNISGSEIKKIHAYNINPRINNRILFENVSSADLLEGFANSYWGQGTGDLARFRINIWEVEFLGEKWAPLISPVDRHIAYGGRSQLVKWDNGKGELVDLAEELVDRLKNIHFRGSEAWGKKGISLRLMGKPTATIFTGEIFDLNVATIIPNNENILLAIYIYAESGELENNVRKIDKKLNLTNLTLLKIPFDLSYWQNVAAEKYPNGLPKPWSNDPTQWLFDGHLGGSEDPNVLDADGRSTRPGLAEHPLQVAVARLLGYRWPRQNGSSFMDCPAIDELDEIDTAGLADADGIVAFDPLDGESPAHVRLRDLMRVAFGDTWHEGVVRDCLRAEEARAEDLETWLRDEFFEGHCRLFHQTPFVWHIWDGLPGGFSALVNYHKLTAPDGAGRRVLEKLRDTHLGEWIARQKDLASRGDATAGDRVAAADHLKGELTKILEGEPPYDLFIRWKPLSKQPIGWEPDIDDGVRLNIRPFLTARPWHARSQKACILRVTPGVKKHTGADRGGEPSRAKADYPWFWAEDADVAKVDFPGGDEFKGRRYNDFHYTTAAKRRAREAGDGGKA